MTNLERRVSKLENALIDTNKTLLRVIDRHSKAENIDLQLFTEIAEQIEILKGALFNDRSN